METKMETNTNVASDVLHSSNPSKLSPEEIAKAVARHNRHHPGTKTAVTSGKPQTGAKK
jgi:threonine aldolase